MATELRNLLGQARDELGAPHQPLDDLGWSRVVRAVRRRRTQRHAVESVVGVAAAGAVAVAGWAGLTHQAPPPPAHTPSPTANTTPSPTSTPSTTPTPTATTAPIPTSSPGLPPSLPLPAGVLEDASTGWVLAVHRPAWLPVDDSADERTVVANVVYLVAPTGERYRLLDLPLEPRTDVLHWRAGDTRALVATTQADGSMPRPGMLDLRDGTLTPVSTPESSWYAGTTASGSHLWVTDTGDEPRTRLVETDDSGAQIDRGPSGDVVHLDPTGRRVAWLRPDTSGTTVLDLQTGERHDVLPMDRPWPCRPVSWVDATQLLLTCADYSDGSDGMTGAVYRVDATRADATPSLVASAARYGGLPSTGEPLGDGRVAAVMSRGSDCPAGVSVLAGTEHTALALPADFSHHISVEDGRIYVASFPGCSGDLVPTTLSVFGLDGQGVVELGPLPDPPANDPSGAERRWTDTLTSWAVGADR